MNTTFSAAFFFCGLGAGARGFLDEAARLGPASATFTNLGGIDIDAEACEDFEMLTGAKALCADMSKVTPEQVRALMGDRRPDCIFTSPPCKGFSGLLSAKNSKKPKYQALNRLVLQGLFLACEAWSSPPPVIVMENVPRIQTRGKDLLAQAKQLLSRYGYVFHMATHDCGQIGGLAQHRKRFLLIARRPQEVPGYIYRPPTKRVRGCGEVLESLPMPEAPEAGALHRLPALSWLNWVRLALIPAGGDWRDLPKGPVAVMQDETKHKGRPDAYGVQSWEKPAKSVRGNMRVHHSPASVADPRLAERGGRHTNKYAVTGWENAVGTITGAGSKDLGTGAPSVADPRLCSPVQEGEERRAHFKRYHIARWDEAVRTVAGSGTNGNYGVADPRLPNDAYRGSYGVNGWEDPTGVITGNARPPTGKFSVADPRMSTDNPGRHHNKYVVTDWKKPVRSVIGATRPGSGALSIADPRTPPDPPIDPQLKCSPRRGAYGVMSWDKAAATITGSMQVDNGIAAVADSRDPGEVAEVPVIISADGTWHRPLTTLELAALQGMPSMVNGKPLKLAGKSVARWRERIGNAVPVQAASAIAKTILTALLAGHLGTWTVSGGGVWVDEYGRTEDDVNREWEVSDGCQA